MKRMIKYPSIGQFRNIVKNVAEQHDIEIEFDVLASDYFTYDELKELA